MKMKKEDLMMTVYEEGVGTTKYTNRYYVPFATKTEIEEVYDRYLNRTPLVHTGLPKGKNLIRIRDVEIDVMTDDEVEDYKFLEEVA